MHKTMKVRWCSRLYGHAAGNEDPLYTVITGFHAVIGYLERLVQETRNCARSITKFELTTCLVPQYISFFLVCNTPEQKSRYT